AGAAGRGRRGGGGGPGRRAAPPPRRPPREPRPAGSAPSAKGGRSVSIRSTRKGSPDRRRRTSNRRQRPADDSGASASNRATKFGVKIGIRIAVAPSGRFGRRRRAPSGRSRAKPASASRTNQDAGLAKVERPPVARPLPEST